MLASNCALHVAAWLFVTISHPPRIVFTHIRIHLCPLPVPGCTSEDLLLLLPVVVPAQMPPEVVPGLPEHRSHRQTDHPSGRMGFLCRICRIHLVSSCSVKRVRSPSPFDAAWLVSSS
jgi:hypothetical protein